MSFGSRKVSYNNNLNYAKMEPKKLSILDELIESQQNYDDIDYNDIPFINEEALQRAIDEDISYNEALEKLEAEKMAKIEAEKKRREEAKRHYEEWEEWKDSLEYRVKDLDKGSLEYRNTVLQYRIEQAGGLGTRNAVVAAATYLSEEEDIPYFWGGKSLKNGVNPKWGQNEIVIDSGNPNQLVGSSRPYGLDCSGFTGWSIVNGGFQIGAEGTEAFIGYSTPYSFTADNLKNGIIKPGDLLHRNGHIAIITGLDLEHGTIKVAEEKGTDYGMVVTEKNIDEYVAGETFTSILSMEDFYNNPQNLQN